MQPGNGRKKKAAPAGPGRSVTVYASVKRDLSDLARVDPTLAASGLAASALALARMIDNKENSATSRSMCARELRETLDRLRELAPPEEVEDGIDELNARARLKLVGNAS